jgi:hypothetical protein
LKDGFRVILWVFLGDLAPEGIRPLQVLPWKSEFPLFKEACLFSIENTKFQGALILIDTL